MHGEPELLRLTVEYMNAVNAVELSMGTPGEGGVPDPQEIAGRWSDALAAVVDERVRASLANG